MMKKTILLPLLTIFVCAAILLGASFGLAGIGEKNAQEAHLQLLRTLLPDSQNFTLEPYTGEDANIVSVHKGEPAHAGTCQSLSTPGAYAAQTKDCHMAVFYFFHGLAAQQHAGTQSSLIHVILL